MNNKRILDFLRKHFACDDATINAWCGTWISAEFEALETVAAGGCTAPAVQPDAQ